ncbi:hypothetical protein SCHPADRAFT_819011 [Schizopora paradoxa]|uniref:DNA-directed RNA polymerase III subunit RPC6 n=1 Tax=Schizopora paradoxa TaxID=27342 RepID=A0A0H2SAV9_9AGAM|nr:hypothetical protein SCHPADRAFT_819011 [Schizopora paradoxa]
MSKRKLDATEKKLHQAILAGNQATLTHKQVDAVVPDSAARTQALNVLLGTGLIRALRDAKGALSFRAVAQKELDVKKDLSDEESLVLNHIQAAQNEGIWTKHLKAKTDLHQTVIDRCLKTLVQKQIIKSVTNVKHRTRKTYMMAHLEPSVAITGGPWYTENELDTAFISLLLSACLRFIQEKSFPKTKNDNRLLYPTTNAPTYPTALQVKTFLSKSRITETEFSIEHIETLLNVLVTDGEIEKLPAFGMALWDANAHQDEAEESSEEELPSKKRKKKGESSKAQKKRRKKGKDSDSEQEPDNDRETIKEDPTTDEDQSSSKKKGKKKEPESDEHGLNLGVVEEFGGGHVYRAVRKEAISLGWTQAPCGHCKQFSFCNERGPVNPKGCEYYDGWLSSAIVDGK